MPIEEEKKLILKEGNDIREELLKLLKNVQNFWPRILRRNKEKLDSFEKQYSEVFENKITPYDKKSSLLSEKLASADQLVDVKNNQPKILDLNDRLSFTLHGYDLSLQRESLKNLSQNIENKINRHRESLNNFTILKYSYATLFVAILGIFIGIVQIKSGDYSTNQLLSSANNNSVLQIMYSLNQELIFPPNSNILYSVNNNLPIRIKNGGNFSDTQLENYLSTFEAIGVLYAGNTIKPFGDSGAQNPFLCDSFFDPIKDSLNNNEIKNFIKEKRKNFPAYQSYLDVLKNAVDNYEMCPEFN